MKLSIAVLGLGKFGKKLAESLYAMGSEVLVADKREEVVREFAGHDGWEDLGIAHKQLHRCNKKRDGKEANPNVV